MQTPFPYHTSEVVPLPVPEFTCALELGSSASFERACRRFLDDANRTLVWFIRFRALSGGCECGDTAAWLASKPARVQCPRELAASFDLNEDWQCDADRFRVAVDSIVSIVARDAGAGVATPGSHPVHRCRGAEAAVPIVRLDRVMPSSRRRVSTAS